MSGAEGVVVDVAGLEIAFGGAGSRINVLSNASFTLEVGERVALLGPSGAGKSSLLHALIGLLPVKADRLVVCGRDVALLPSRELAAMRGRDIGFVFQSSHLFSRLSAVDNVAVRLQLLGESQTEARAVAVRLLTSLQLDHRLDKKVSVLSAGEQQRVAIARALANRPAVLLADEPTANLDPMTAMKVVDVLDEMTRAEGCALLLATHDYDAADRMERVLIIEDGSIAAGRVPARARRRRR